jgi:hypothetical protein
VETTQNQILAAAEKATGTKFDVAHIESQTVWSDLEEKAVKADAGAIKSMLTGIAISKKVLSDFGEKADKWNALLIDGQEKESVEEVVSRVVKGEGPQGKWVTQN